jgi:hypothetical protein
MLVSFAQVLDKALAEKEDCYFRDQSKLPYNFHHRRSPKHQSLYQSKVISTDALRPKPLRGAITKLVHKQVERRTNLTEYVSRLTREKYNEGLVSRERIQDCGFLGNLEHLYRDLKEVISTVRQTLSMFR